MLPECLGDALGTGVISNSVWHQPKAISTKALKKRHFLQAKRIFNA